MERVAKEFKFGRRVLFDGPVETLLRAAEPEVVISIDGYLQPSQVERWRVLSPNARWVLWYPDHLANLGAQYALAAPYDVLFFKDRHLVDILTSRAGLPAEYLPEACNPSRHRTESFASPAEEKRYSCDVTLAGNLYPYRARVLAQLPTSIDLRLYGNLTRLTTHPRVRAAFTGRYVTGREKALAFRGAKIVLNTLHLGEIRSVNARLFEAAGCGAFVITQSSPVLSELFRPGKEVVAVDTANEMRDAIEHYIHSDERHAIAAAGQARAHGEHTYDNRLDSMSACIGVEL
jgi:spore maturation protein CgeB